MRQTEKRLRIKLLTMPGRLFVHLTLPLVTAFMAAVLLIRAQPYDNSNLRALLIPPGCPMPCFLGIRPGITTVREAVKLLEASGWVDGNGVAVRLRFNIVRLEWHWSGLQPATLDSTSQGVAMATVLPGFNQDSTLDEQARVITGLSIVTTIPYGEARLLLGRGDNKPDYVLSRSYTNPRITAVYSDYDLVILSALMPCPVSLADFWNQTVVLQIGYTFVDDFVHVCQGAA